jgi:hypothetical protein
MEKMRTRIRPNFPLPGIWIQLARQRPVRSPKLKRRKQQTMLKKSLAHLEKIKKLNSEFKYNKKLIAIS